jgi:hypothetical protein
MPFVAISYVPPRPDLTGLIGLTSSSVQIRMQVGPLVARLVSRHQEWSYWEVQGWPNHAPGLYESPQGWSCCCEDQDRGPVVQPFPLLALQAGLTVSCDRLLRLQQDRSRQLFSRQLFQVLEPALMKLAVSQNLAELVWVKYRLGWASKARLELDRWPNGEEIASMSPKEERGPGHA